MPVVHTPHKWYAVDDAKLAALATDPTGGTATYGTSVDLPGIKTVGISFEINNKELRGDNRRLESDSTLVGINGTFSHAKMNIDAVPILIGGTVVDSGVAPNQTARYRRIGTDSFSNFKFEARTPANGVNITGGDGHMVIYKAKVSSYELGHAEEDYQIFSGTFSGVYRVSDDVLWDLILNETAAAIV